MTIMKQLVKQTKYKGRLESEPKGNLKKAVDRPNYALSCIIPKSLMHTLLQAEYCGFESHPKQL